MPSVSFANQLFSAIERARTLEQLLQEPLAWMVSHGNWSTIWVMSTSKGAWKKLLAVGKPVTDGPSSTTLGDCLDSRRTQSDGAWTLQPISAGVDLIFCLANPTVQAGAAEAQDALREQFGLLAHAVELWNQQLRRTRDVVGSIRS